MKNEIPPGTKLRLPGLPVDVEVRPEEELIGEDICRIACTKADHDKGIAEGVVYVEGTKAGYFCRVCNTEIVLAPSGQRLEAMGGTFTCIHCAFRMLMEEKS